MHFEREAREFLAEASQDEPLLAVLRGDLGAGKTTFVKTALAQLGYPPAGVQSPTFLKLFEYEVPAFGLCLHLDGYRLESEDEFGKLALEAYSEARAWFVEWPELFLKHLEHHPTLRRHLSFKDYWELDFEKMDPILGSVGGGGRTTNNPAPWRGIRWRRKSF